jgi:hypothetical protein
MLNPNTVYFKTEAGVSEVKARVLGLRAELRRLLILVDGTAPLSRLAIFVRGSEIDYLIAELELQGLVTSGMGALTAIGESIVVRPSPTRASLPVSTPTAPVLDSPSPVPHANLEPTTGQMLAVRYTAINTLNELLGPDALSLAAKIEQCKDAQELRVAITDIRQTLDRQLGADTGQRFLDAVRTAAEGTR